VRPRKPRGSSAFFTRQRHFRFVAVAAGAIGLLAASATSGQERVLPKRAQPKGIDLDALLAAHNQIRADAKRAPLKSNRQLAAAALDHARDMAEHRALSHEGTDGSSPSQRVKQHGYRYRDVGENVAEGQDSIEEVIRTWMDSPPHRENILGDYTEMGAGVATDAGNTKYWCVVLGRPVPSVDPNEAPAAFIAAFNRARAEAKKRPVKADVELARAAGHFAREMAARHKLESKDRDGLTPLDILTRRGYKARRYAYCGASGETEAEKVVRSCLEGKREREDLLADFDRIGVGIAADNERTTYWFLILAQTARARP
jgi:uncharacterized protein YkwD